MVVRCWHHDSFKPSVHTVCVMEANTICIYIYIYIYIYEDAKWLPGRYDSCKALMKRCICDVCVGQTVLSVQYCLSSAVCPVLSVQCCLSSAVCPVLSVCPNYKTGQISSTFLHALAKSSGMHTYLDTQASNKNWSNIMHVTSRTCRVHFGSALAHKQNLHDNFRPVNKLFHGV